MLAGPRSPSLDVLGTIGAMSVGFVLQQGRYSRRAAVMLLTAALVALATFAGAPGGNGSDAECFADRGFD